MAFAYPILGSFASGISFHMFVYSLDLATDLATCKAFSTKRNMCYESPDQLSCTRIDREGNPAHAYTCKYHNVNLTYYGAGVLAQAAELTHMTRTNVTQPRDEYQADLRAMA